MSLLEELTVKPHSGKTLVVDTISGIEALANAYHCKTSYNGDWSVHGYMDYHSGYRSLSAGVWKESLVALDRLRSAKKMMIVLLAHTGDVKVPNTLGADYRKCAPAFASRWAWDATFAWADMVLFADFAVEVTTAQGEKGKGHGDARILRANWNPAFDAKNRHGISDDIEMGNSGKEAWDNVLQAIAAMSPNNN